MAVETGFLAIFKSKKFIFISQQQEDDESNGLQESPNNNNNYKSPQKGIQQTKYSVIELISEK